MFSFSTPSVKTVAITTVKIAASAAIAYGGLVLIKKYGNKVTDIAGKVVNDIDKQIVGG